MDTAKIGFKGMRLLGGLLAAGMLAIVAVPQAWAGLTDLATYPLATSSGTAVRPNILFTLDNSGSMAWDFLPDYTGGGMGTTYPHCKTSNGCNQGEVPFQANKYNGLSYNPSTTYGPPVNFDGTFKPSQTAANTASWTAVQQDGYGVQATGTINLTNSYNESIYCDSAGSGICKQNGIDTNNPFFVDATGTGLPPNYALPGKLNVPTSYTVTGTTNLFTAGTLNGPTSTPNLVFNGTLNNGSPSYTTITLNSPSVSLSGSTVTLTYSSQSPASPAIVTGDAITVSGTSCSSGYTVTNTPITVSSTTPLTLTYAAGGAGKKNTSCGTATVSHKTVPVVAAPSISSDNVTVTVILATPHGLATNDTVSVTNGSGTCDGGYRTTGSLVTVINSTTFTYLATAVLGTASNTTCNISKLVFTPPVAPGIDIAGNVVTVNLTGHGLATGDFVQVTGAGCGTAFATGTAPGKAVTVLDANTFTYLGTTGGTTGRACSIAKATVTVVYSLLSFTTATSHNGAPYEYVIIPVEFCDSPYLTSCVASSVPTGVYTYPAYVRFCSSATIAALAPGAAGAQKSAGTITCQGLFSTGGGTNYTSVRYGLFYRTDVLPGIATYGNHVLNATVNANGTSIVFSGVTVLDRSGRTDCAAAPNCTYPEEMTNFANWYAYYRTRIQMMKTSAGMAFQPMDNRYRVGFATINESWVVPTATAGGQWLPVAMFDSVQKQKWYNAMYSINPGNSTPLREAVARAGRYFAGKHGLPGDPITDDPMEFSCQQNYLLITTDGYWNGTTSNVVDLKGVQIGNVDNNPANPATTRAQGVYDGGVAGASTTLADTAAYYYLTDLRTAALGNCTSGSTTQPGNLLCTSPAVNPDPLDNVPAGANDPVGGGLMWQHMVTFSLGLANGLMLYQSDYDTATTGDFASIKTGSSGCPFSGAGICNWPLPVSDMPTALDDLWHAAVNGRGKFYNARDPVSLSKGLSSALSGIQVQTGSSAASATSSPNITQTDRSIFSSTYRTVKWDGEVVAQLLDPTTGNVPAATLTAMPALSTISLAGTTVVVGMNSHGLANGDMIQVGNSSAGTCDPAFNTGGQSFPVTVLNANSFTYSSPNSVGATTNTACQVYKAGISWSAQTQLDIKVKAATDPEIRTRFIYTDDTSQGFPLNTTNTSLPMNGLKEFRYNLLPAVDQALFDYRCTTIAGVPILSQCTAWNLTTAQIASANMGSNLIPYLRGNQTLEQTLPNPAYRPRDHFLGDTVNARPAYVRAPTFDFQDAVTPSYATFKANNQTRYATIYVAANDGMLHAFDAGQCLTSTSCTVGTGNERWAYVPHETLYNLYKLADVNYGSNHQYFVDGSPEIMDIYVNNTYSTASGLAVGWHTILVGGLNGGGRGYYALDITDPSIPIGLWDVCATGTVGQCSVQDADLGYSYGNPVITKRNSDGNWVVMFTSGYNNVSPGSGQGVLYVVDAIMGNILQKIPTGSGSTTAPSGLSKIAAYADNSTQNNTTRFVYGGDLNGDVWRFDLGTVATAYSATSPVAVVSSPLVSTVLPKRFVTLYDASAVAQPITTRPELGDPWTTPGTINSLNATGLPAVFIGTGRYLGVSDVGNNQVQTIYALEDDFSVAGPTFPTAAAVPNPRTLLPTGSSPSMVVQSFTAGVYSNKPVNWTTPTCAGGGSKCNEGWYLDFPNTGERVNLDPQLALGTLIVVTNAPSTAGACVTGGTSNMYQFNFRNGNSMPGSSVVTSLGNAISVGFVVVRLPSGQLKVIVTNASGQKTSQTVAVSGSAATRNVSWRELLQ